MIRVTVELISAVHPSRNRVLGTAEISNTGKGTETKAKYRYRLFGKGGRLLEEGHVDDVPRKQMLGWDLLTIVLVHARGEKVMKKLGR